RRPCHAEEPEPLGRQGLFRRRVEFAFGGCGRRLSDFRRSTGGNGDPWLRQERRSSALSDVQGRRAVHGRDETAGHRLHGTQKNALGHTVRNHPPGRRRARRLRAASCAPQKRGGRKAAGFKGKTPCPRKAETRSSAQSEATAQDKDATLIFVLPHPSTGSG